MSAVVDASVYGAFERIASQFGPRPFLRAPAASTKNYAPGAIEYSYSEARVAVDRLRAGFSALDLPAGARVALAYDARLDVYLHLLALNSLGVSMVPLNMSGSDEELLYVIEHSDALHVVAAPEYVSRLSAICAGIDGCRVLSGEALLGEGVGKFAPIGAITPATEAAMLYTSGTTGQPKGCMLSNDYFLGIGRWYVGLDGLCRLESSDRLVTPLPPNHMNALCTSFTGMLLCGGCVIQLDRFHPSSWWQTLREEQATVIHYLGVMPAILLTSPESSTDPMGHQIKFGFGAGSDPRHQAVFERRFGFPLIEAWAMTETGSGGMTIADCEPRHVGQRCIGKPVAAMAYRIVDENDADVVPGAPGELLVRCNGDDPRKGFFSGYYKDAEATEQGWTGGWWHTGDVVRVDEAGTFFFVDRRKNIIRRSGENIAAVEVEAVLLRSPHVSNCAVTAVPDEMRGDEVFAFLTPAEEGVSDDKTTEAIFDHCTEHLSYFKTPGYFAYISKLPLTGSQKVRRGDVKAMAREAVEAGQCTDLRFRKKLRNKGHKR